MKNLKIGDKLTRIPLIQGGMGVGISLGRLAGSVAKEGGIGIISTAQIGYREADFDADPEKANLRAIDSEMKKARAISPDGIIGYNVMTAKSGRKSRGGHYHIRSRTSDRASGAHGRKPDEDRTHRVDRQVSERNPQVLGQKVQENCGSCRDRGSGSRRTSGI